MGGAGLEPAQTGDDSKPTGAVASAGPRCLRAWAWHGQCAASAGTSANPRTAAPPRRPRPPGPRAAGPAGLQALVGGSSSGLLPAEQIQLPGHLQARADLRERRRTDHCAPLRQRHSPPDCPRRPADTTAWRAWAARVAAAARAGAGLLGTVEQVQPSSLLPPGPQLGRTACVGQGSLLRQIGSGRRGQRKKRQSGGLARWYSGHPAGRGYHHHIGGGHRHGAGTQQQGANGPAAVEAGVEVHCRAFGQEVGRKRMQGPVSARAGPPPAGRAPPAAGGAGVSASFARPKGVVGLAGHPGIRGFGAVDGLGTDGLDDIAAHVQKHALADKWKRQPVRKVVIGLGQPRVAAQHGHQRLLLGTDAVARLLGPECRWARSFCACAAGYQLHLLVTSGPGKAGVQAVPGASRSSVAIGLENSGMSSQALPKLDEGGAVRPFCRRSIS